jgi:hypothetical protein
MPPHTHEVILRKCPLKLIAIVALLCVLIILAGTYLKSASETCDRTAASTSESSRLPLKCDPMIGPYIICPNS